MGSDPIAAVFALERFGIKLGLESIRAICAALGNPQHQFDSIIIGGTNGKGSVTAMVDCALRAAGHRCARYTSPHLVRLEERFVIDGREVQTAALARSATRVLEAIDRLRANGTLPAPPTFFEATTAIAFDLFCEAGVRVAVLEVGLGGRLDATNVVDAIAAVITSIDRDHEQQLGNTLEQIAAEKAGIIKPGKPVVLGPMDDAPRQVIQAVAAERQAHLIEASPRGGCGAARDDAAGTIVLSTPVREYPAIRLGLSGEHQAWNALVAVRLLEVLDRAGLTVPVDAVARGFRDVTWPGRLEWISFEGKRLLLDAAHNPAGARTLAAYLASRRHESLLPLVFGAVRDKDVRGMVAMLAPVVERFVTTQADTPRAMPAHEVALQVREVAPGTRVVVVPDALDACRTALADSPQAVVAGSIFLIGEVRGRLAK